MTEEFNKEAISRGWITRTNRKHDYSTDQKTCTICNATHKRSPEFFGISQKTPDKLTYNCRKCLSIIQKKSRDNSPRFKIYQKSPDFVFSQLKHQAKKRGYSFEITKEYYEEKLAHSNCHYCGSDKTKHWVDRRDNFIGYTKENTVPCCEMCNKTKLHFNEQDWLTHCKKIADFNR